MQAHKLDEILRPGDVFVTRDGLSYLTRGFEYGHMVVGELDTPADEESFAQSKLYVPVREIPSSGEFRRLTYIENFEGPKRGGYINDLLGALRTSLSDLKQAAELGVDARYVVMNDGSPFTYRQGIEDTVFRFVEYEKNGSTFTVKISGFDADKLGLIPDRLVRRGGDGRVVSYAADIDTYKLEQGPAQAAHARFSDVGIDTNLSSWIGSGPVIGGSSAQPNIMSRVCGWIVNGSRDPVEYDTLTKAHTALQEKVTQLR